MAINLDQQPEIEDPNPVENCLIYIIDNDDFNKIDIGSSASFSINIDAFGSNGTTTMTLLNETFTGNGTGLRSWVETSGDSAATRVAAILAMLKAQPEFINVNFTVGVPQPTITIFGNWNIKGLQQNFTFANVDVVNITIGSSNGTSPQFDLNKKIWWQLLEEDDTELGARQFITAPGNTFSFNEMPIDARAIVSPFLLNPFPSFSDFSGTGKFQTMTDFIQTFNIRFGSVDLNQCDIHYGEIFRGDSIRVFDGAFQEEEGINSWHPYSLWENSLLLPLTDETRTVQPICNGSYEWKWFLLDGPDSGSKRFDFITLEVEAYDIDGNLVNGYSDPLESVTGGSRKQAIAVPVGQQNASPYVRANAAGDVVSWIIKLRLSDSIDDSFFYAWTQEFKLFDCACETEEFYFKEPKGGFKTMTFEKSAQNLTVTGNLISVPIPCDDINLYRKGGNQIVGKRAVNTFLTEVKKIHKNSFDLIHIHNLLISEEVYIKFSKDEEIREQRVYILPGSYVLFQENGLTTVEFEWGLHSPTKIVSYVGL